MLEGSRRTNYDGQAGRGVQRQEERPEARQGVGFVQSSPWQGDCLKAGEGANKLTKHAQATRCRKNDGSTLANRRAGNTQRVSLKSPVRANRTPRSVGGRRATGVPASTRRGSVMMHGAETATSWRSGPCPARKGSLDLAPSRGRAFAR
jgi:hypothetical protein